MLGSSPGAELRWNLLYTKPRAESWADINLRRQGFETLLPLVNERGGITPLFPRYVFVGYHADQRVGSMRNTLGVLNVVYCGEHPARVPAEVIDELRARMNAHGVVRLDDEGRRNALFSRQQRERIRALVKLSEAGYRVKIA